ESSAATQWVSGSSHTPHRSSHPNTSGPNPLGATCPAPHDAERGAYMLVTAAVLTILRLAVDPTPAARELPVAAILDEVRAIWRPYVTIVVTSPSTACDACGPAVHLRFNDDERPVAADEPHALGWIEFVDGVPSPRITVSRARARILVAASEWMGRP